MRAALHAQTDRAQGRVLQPLHNQGQPVRARRRRVHQEQRTIQPARLGDHRSVRVHQAGGHQDVVHVRGGELRQTAGRVLLRADVQGAEDEVRPAPGQAEGHEG